MNESSPHILFIQAARSPGIEQMLDRIVPWVLNSDRAYLRALLTGLDTPKILANWLLEEKSEIALQKTRLLIADDRMAGGFIGFAGRQLRRRRETDLVDVVRRSDESRSDLRDRLKDLLPLFAPVAPNDFYVSKLGISPGMSEPTMAKQLVDECIDCARRDGYDRVRIDIDAEDKPLTDLLVTRGFAIVDRGEATDAGVSYLNLLREL